MDALVDATDARTRGLPGNISKTMTPKNQKPMPTPPLPTVEALAIELLIFEYTDPHERQWGCDVMLQIIDGRWQIARVDFEQFLSDSRRFYIGPGMQRYEAFAIARGMLRAAQREVRS